MRMSMGHGSAGSAPGEHGECAADHPKGRDQGAEPRGSAASAVESRPLPMSSRSPVPLGRSSGQKVPPMTVPLLGGVPEGGMGGTWRGTGDGLLRAAVRAASRLGAQPVAGGVRRRRTQRMSGPVRASRSWARSPGPEGRRQRADPARRNPLRVEGKGCLSPRTARTNGTAAGSLSATPLPEYSRTMAGRGFESGWSF